MCVDVCVCVFKGVDACEFKGVYACVQGVRVRVCSKMCVFEGFV